MARFSRALGAALSALLAIAALAACGGGDDEAAAGSAGSGDAGRASIALMSDTFGSGHAVRSGKLDLSLSLEAKGLKELSEPMSITVRGPFRAGAKGELPGFDLDAQVDAGATKLSLGAVSTADGLWVRYQGKTYALPSELLDQARKATAGAQGTGTTSTPSTLSLDALGLDPERWLKAPRTIGDEQVAGAPTTHVTADIDVGRLLDDLMGVLGKVGAGAAPTLTADDRRQLEAAVSTARLDVWTGRDDHALRRLKLAVAFEVPVSARAKANGLESGKLGFSLTIAELNEPQSITAPKQSEPLSGLSGVLGSLLGGALPPTGSTTTAPAAGGVSSAYVACLGDAAGDVDKIRRCAELLEK